MSRLKSRLLVGAALAAAAVSLAACGDDNDNVATTPTPTPTPAPRFSEFGTNFAARFGAGTNTEAADAASGDVASPSLTAEPQAV